MTIIAERSRVPAGITTGGQFAHTLEVVAQSSFTYIERHVCLNSETGSHALFGAYGKLVP